MVLVAFDWLDDANATLSIPFSDNLAGIAAYTHSDKISDKHSIKRRTGASFILRQVEFIDHIFPSCKIPLLIILYNRWWQKEKTCVQLKVDASYKFWKSLDRMHKQAESNFILLSTSRLHKDLYRLSLTLKIATSAVATKAYLSPSSRPRNPSKPSLCFALSTNMSCRCRYPGKRLE